jgi:hypothetical protein
MNKHSLKTQLIFSAIFFALSFCVLFFVYQQIKNIEHDGDQKLTEWRIESARRDEIKSLDSLMKKIEPQKELLYMHFAESLNPVPFLDTIERLATSVNAKNKVSSVDISKDGKSLIVGMNASGSFESFYKFLTLLENSQYNLEFLSIDMQKSGEVGSATTSAPLGDWSAAIKIKLLTFIK